MKYFNQILIGLITATASTLMFNDALGQSVGVAINDDNTAPYQDAILDMKHSTDPQLGVLFPRAASNWTPAAGARNGLIYYNTTYNEYRYWDNAGAGAWRTLLSVGATLPYIENQISTPQTPTSSPFSNFWISGEGKIGTNLTVGTESGTGSIILSDDDAWIGRGATVTDPKIAFDATAGNIKVFPVKQMQVSITSPGSNVTSDDSNTAFTITNTTVSDGVGLKLSGNRGSAPSGTSTREIGFIDFENTNVTPAIFARIGVTNPSASPDFHMFHISLRSGGNLVERLSLSDAGNLAIAGKFTSLGIQETSDARFKKNINGISNALSTVLNLEGVTYNWRTEEFPERSFTDRTEYGVIAQQIEKFVPELVSTDENGYKSVQYSHMVPLLLEAIKEQQEIINSQSKELGVLKASVEAISEYIKTAQK